MDSQLQQARDLEKKLEAVFPLEGSAAFADLDDEIAFLLRLFRAKVLFEIESTFQGPLLAVVAGGTNVGKSEVFNALACDSVSKPDPRAGRTRRPAVYGGKAAEKTILNPGFLAGYERAVLEDAEVLNTPWDKTRTFHYRLSSKPALPGILLVDSPDIDSNRAENLVCARHMLAAADAIIFVTSPSKYNDEACVRFLKQAHDLGRAVFVVFNLLAEDRDTVLGDFRTSVLGGPSWLPPVFTLSRLQAGADVHEEMKSLLADLGKGLAATTGPRVKYQQARISLTYLTERYQDVVDGVGADLTRIEDVTASAARVVAGARSAYSAALDNEKYVELEVVFRQVLDHFDVPIIDDVLKAPSRALKWIVRKVRGESSEHSEAEARIQRRKDKDRRKLAETADALRAGVLQDLARSGSDPILVSVMSRAAAGSLGASCEEEAASAWERLEPRFIRWRDEMRDEMIEKISASPNLRLFIQTSKAALTLGAGVAAAVLTGGVGPTDLVTGPLTAKLVQVGLETFGSQYFQDKRRAFRDLHLERFDQVMDECVLSPLAEALPLRPDREALEASLVGLKELTLPRP